MSSSIEGIDNLINLEELTLKINKNIKNISKLGFLNKLNKLIIINAISIININFIRKLKNLQKLELYKFQKLKDFSPLEDTFIYDIYFEDCKYLVDLYFIHKMKYIDIICIDTCVNLNHISPILDKSSLRKLYWYDSNLKDEVINNILYIFGKTKNKYLEIYNSKSENIDIT